MKWPIPRLCFMTRQDCASAWPPTVTCSSAPCCLPARSRRRRERGAGRVAIRRLIDDRGIPSVRDTCHSLDGSPGRPGVPGRHVRPRVQSGSVPGTARGHQADTRHAGVLVPGQGAPRRLSRTAAARPRGRYIHCDYGVSGVQDMLTSWIPLMEIPPRIGGLAVQPGGHLGPPRRPRPLSATEPGWATTNYEPGDVLGPTA